MRPFVRAVLLFVATTVLAGATGGCASRAGVARPDAPGLSNLGRVDAGLWRCAQPTREGFRSAERLGVKTVVNLRAERADAGGLVRYPEGYRGWPHVKSSLVSPSHADYERLGGFQHIYANAEAMEGYRTREFPEGSVIVFDWLEMVDTAEGPRRQTEEGRAGAERLSEVGRGSDL